MKTLSSSLNTSKTISLLALALVGALTVGSHQAKADALGELGGDPVAQIEGFPTTPPTIPMGITPYQECKDKAETVYRKCRRDNPKTPILCQNQRKKQLEKCEEIVE